QVLFGQDLRALAGRRLCRVVDVRQSPFSKRFPHFCAKPLKASLEAAGIDYEHNEWLGGKGRAVVYDDQWNGTATKEGIEKVLKLIESLKDGRVTVLLCSEGDWRQCHREILADIIVYSGAASDFELIHNHNYSAPHQGSTLEYTE
ncbi:hypothetical protein FOZ63_010230, partial [Perkinsus olseni]